MNFWFSEMHTDNVKLSIRVEKQLFSATSDFQRIDVFDSIEFGRFLTSDGNVIFSDKDEFIYDEMIVHVPMAVHPNVKNVLVIGGGDGGVARELGHYDEIESIDVVEADELFVKTCRDYFPDQACGFDDKRVQLHYRDGLRFLRGKSNEYDLIISDSTDPLGHTAGLLPRNSMAPAIRRLRMTASWYTSTEVPFTMRTRKPAGPCTERHTEVSRYAVCIRHIYLPAHRVTGFLALPARNTIRLRI